MLSNCCFKAQGRLKFTKVRNIAFRKRKKIINILNLIFDILVCAKGWRDINGKCFLISTDSNDVPYQLNYEEAVEICYFKGGKLFEPSNETILHSVSEVNEYYRSYVTLQIKR